jgi:hypothetical protein
LKVACSKVQAVAHECEGGRRVEHVEYNVIDDLRAGSSPPPSGSI